MRYFIAVIFSIMVMVGCTSQATFGDAITEGEPTPIPTPVIPNKPVYQVQRGDIVYEQQYFGRISPVVSSQIESHIDGRLLEINVSVGTDVTEGDVLATLDTAVLEAQLLDAQAALAVAQSMFDSADNQIIFGQQRAQINLDLAQLSLDYARSQASDPPTPEDTFIISTRELERDLAQLQLDELTSGVDPELRFDVTRAQNRVDELEAMISNAAILAPIDGRVISFTASTGDDITAFTSIGIVSDVSKLEVTDVLNTDELSELTEGMSVTMQRANIPGEVYIGTIAALPSPFGGASDEFIHIQFDTPPSPDTFNVGDRLTFSIVVEERQDVLWLPTSAIRQFGGRNFVVIQNEGVQQRVDVQLGLEGDERIEITDGLEEDQTVIGP